MATLGQPIPQSSDSVAFEGGYDVVNNRTATKQIINSQQANNTTYGPQLVSSPAIVAIAATTPPTATTALTDTLYTFSSKVNHVFIQNNYTTSIQFDLDAVSTAGSMVLVAGQTFEMDIMATVIHLYTPSIMNINGTSLPNIVIKGWQ